MTEGIIITRESPPQARKTWMCHARKKTCRQCGHRFTRDEYESWYCPECGEDRHCRARKVAGYNVCTKHGGGSPSKGKLSGRPPKNRYGNALPSNILKDYENSLRDPELLALRDNIALADARIAQLQKRLNNDADVNNYSQDDDTWEMINDLSERRRKLAQSETYRLVKLQQYITKESAIAFARAVAASVSESTMLISDSELRSQVQNAFEVRLARLMRARRGDLVDVL